MGIDEQPLKKLVSVCLIICDEFDKLSDELKAFNDAIVAKAVGVEPEAEKWVEYKYDPIEELRRLLGDMDKEKAMAEFADLEENPADIPPPRKMPRPPKRIGPVNRSNYTANRPPRVARSSCRSIKR